MSLIGCISVDVPEGRSPFGVVRSLLAREFWVEIKVLPVVVL